MATPDFKVGDWVKFNGSAGRVPRWYHGQILVVKTSTYEIVDNEWYATSEVRKDRVQPWNPEDDK